MQVILMTIFEGFNVELNDVENLFDPKLQPFERIRPHIYSFPRTQVLAKVVPRHKDLKSAFQAALFAARLERINKGNLVGATLPSVRVEGGF